MTKRPERRRRRSEHAHQAISYFLQALKERAGVKALALTTHDGLLLGAAGEHLDLEWMGALGASSARTTLKWEGTTLHVQPVSLKDAELCLTSAGRAIPPDLVEDGLTRILAA